MKKSLFSLLVVGLSAQLAYEYNRNYKFVVIGGLVSLTIWLGFHFLIRPLDIRRVITLSDRYDTFYVVTQT